MGHPSFSTPMHAHLTFNSMHAHLTFNSFACTANLPFGFNQHTPTLISCIPSFLSPIFFKLTNRFLLCCFVYFQEQPWPTSTSMADLTIRPVNSNPGKIIIIKYILFFRTGTRIPTRSPIPFVLQGTTSLLSGHSFSFMTHCNIYTSMIH